MRSAPLRPLRSIALASVCALTGFVTPAAGQVLLPPPSFAPASAVADTTASAQPTRLENPFGLDLPAQIDSHNFSQKKHCDVLRNLKVPATYRRIDSYMRPEFILPFGGYGSDRDQAAAFKGRTKLYEKGIDLYGCSSLDYLHDINSNLSSNPIIAGPGPWHDWQLNINQVIGVDIYSRLWSKKWKGGQIHASFTWPEAGNLGPVYSYGNTLNPAGLGTRQYHGYFYTDVGRSRDVNKSMQGFRLFEWWFQQAYGYKNQSYIRVGQINPWITFNKTLLTGLFGFWSFDEPGVIGTTMSTANGPLITVAPPGVSWEHTFDDHWVGKVMVASGYWDPSGGIDNRRGYKQYWDLDKYGLETTYEVTYKSGTYSLDSKDFGKPWLIRAGGQYHSGEGYSNLYDVNGGYFFLTGAPREVYKGNSQYYATFERMMFRENGSYNQGLTVFLKGKWSPWDYKGSTTKQIAPGFGYEGLFPGRDHDVFFFGYTHMMVNKGVIERSKNQLVCTEVPGCSVAPFQGGYEWGYSAQVKRYLFIDPKLYWVHYPNVRRDLGDIWSFGLEFRASF